MKITVKRKSRLKEENSGYDIVGRALEAITELLDAKESGTVNEDDASVQDVIELCKAFLEHFGVFVEDASQPSYNSDEELV